MKLLFYFFLQLCFIGDKSVQVFSKMAKIKKIKKKMPKAKGQSRRNIRNIMKNVILSDLTKIAVKNEKERKKRVNERAVMVCEIIVIRVICSMLYNISFEWLK